MSFGLGIILAITMGVGMAGIGMCTMHDAIHGSFSKNPTVNKIFGSTIYLIGGNPFVWKILHNIKHHTYTNIYNFDPDIDSRVVVRFAQHGPLSKFHKYQHIHAIFFYGLMTLSKLVSDFWELYKYNKSELTKKHNRNPGYEYLKLVITKATYLFILIGLPVIITDFNWWQVLLLFLTMHWTTGIILSLIFEMAHVVDGAIQPLPNEEGIIENEWAVHQLQTTSDFARNNNLLSWYIGGLNFQIEHHLFPQICHVHYHNIAPIVEQTAKEFGINYNLKPSFINAISSHRNRMKELGNPAITEQTKIENIKD